MTGQVTAPRGSSWAWLGVAAVVLAIITTWAVQFVYSSDDLDAGGQQLLDAIGDGNNEAIYRISSGLGYIAVAMLIAYAAGLKRMLTARAGDQESSIPSVIFGSMIAMAAGFAIAMSFRAQVFDGFDAYLADPSSHVTINRLSQDTVLCSWAALLGATSAAALGGIRGTIFPTWLGWVSAVATVLIAALCLGGLAFPANIPASLWLLVVAIWSVTAARKAA